MVGILGILYGEGWSPIKWCVDDQARVLKAEDICNKKECGERMVERKGQRTHPLVCTEYLKCSKTSTQQCKGEGILAMICTELLNNTIRKNVLIDAYGHVEREKCLCCS